MIESLTRACVRIALVVAAAGAAVSVRAQAQQPSGVGPVERVALTAGRSTVISTDFDITRIAVTNPAVAEPNV